eukprot:m.53569 g.53569  ORF g.53569 m.53569 type:complete len:339 (-) comp13178_c0_seq1:270-1286(-)
MSDGSLNPTFDRIQIKDAVAPPAGKVLVIPSDMTVCQAVEFLHEHNILSAPIRNVGVPDSAPWKEKYTGMMDMIRACVIMLSAFETKPVIREDDESVATGALVLDPLPSSFSERRVSELSESESGLFPFLPLEQDATMLEALVLLGTYRIKRLPIIDKADGDIVNIITQSSMLQILHNNLDKYASIADKTLEQLGLCEARPVMTVRADQYVRHVFNIIREHNVSAVPIMGQNGEMIGNISARHAYYVVTARNKMRMLDMSCTQFLRVTSEMDNSWNIRNTVISCSKNDTLRSVIKRLVSARIHRVYLLDEDKQIVRVIALCDVLEKFVKEPDTGCSLL